MDQDIDGELKKLACSISPSSLGQIFLYAKLSLPKFGEPSYELFSKVSHYSDQSKYFFSILILIF